jgi:hypothetical protein
MTDEMNNEGVRLHNFPAAGCGVKCSAVQCSAVLCCAVLCCAVLCCAVLCCVTVLRVRFLVICVQGKGKALPRVSHPGLLEGVHS